MRCWSGRHPAGVVTEPRPLGRNGSPDDRTVRIPALLLGLALVAVLAGPGEAQAFTGPDTVVVPNGALRLRGLLWRPKLPGRFPAVRFNHGSGRHPSEQGSRVLGPLFAGRGYVFLLLFRRGHGLSADEGPFLGDLLERQLGDSGEDARNRLQVRLLETDHLADALAGLAFLRALDEVDPERVAAIGHSFGGSLTLLLAERDSSLRAVVDFAGAAESWPRSLQRRARLLTAVSRSVVPTFFIQAANDYSVAPARALAAEMAHLGKAHRMTIYPPFGQTADEGHAFVYRAAPTWEADVFAFLSEPMKR